MSKNRGYRVLHVITRMIIGGAQENTILTCKGLASCPDFQVTLLSGPTSGPEGRLLMKSSRSCREYRFIEFKHLCRDISPAKDLLALISMYHFIKKGKYHIVHTHSSKAGIIGRVAAFLAGVPVIVHTIHGLPFHPYEKAWRNVIYRLAEATCAVLTSRIVAVADSMAFQAHAAGVGARGKFRTIRSGMEIGDFSPANPGHAGVSEAAAARFAATRRKLGISDEAFVFIKVARLFEFKGHDYLLDAAARLIRDGNNVHILMVGDGVLRENLTKKARTLGIDNHVTFAGLVPPEHIPGYLSLADAVVHTSLREGLARVLPQGLLMEKPVISFDIDGACEVIRHGETGLLVKPESVNELADAMSYVMQNPLEARRMALKGRKLCERLYDWRRMVKSIRDMYMDLLWESCVEL